MTEVNIKQQEGENPPLRTYSIGQYFLIDDDLCILCQTESEMVNLIHLKSGNRYFSKMHVENIHAITSEEFDSLVCNANDYAIRPVSSVDIKWKL